MSPGTSQLKNVNQVNATSYCLIRTVGWDLPSVADVKVVSSYKISMPDPIIDQLTSPPDLLETPVQRRLTLLRLKLAALLDRIPERADLALEAPILRGPVGFEVGRV